MSYTFGWSEDFNASSIALALSGGVLLGSSVVFKTACLSGVLGISNYSKRLVVQPEMKRVFFLGGMLIASVILSFTYAGTDDLPVPGSTKAERRQLFLRLVLGAFCVGLGASLQHGCTSGHGLTGLARLSPRSWVAVPTFVVVGLATATVLQSAKALPPQVLKDVPEWYVGSTICACLIFFLILLASFLWVVGRRGSPRAKEAGLLLGEFFVGGTFGSGLLISGMARASKVAGFLDVASGHWDLSLPFVMCGGCFVTFPYFQAVRWLNFQTKSFLHEEHMDLPPPNRMPDRTLVLGAALFGFGWAVCGVCPGPMWVNLGVNPSREILVGLMSLLAGLCAQDVAKFTRNLIAETRADSNESSARVVCTDIKKVAPSEELPEAVKTGRPSHFSQMSASTHATNVTNMSDDEEEEC
mmetsp:Transcript_13167/g.28805  ORF Transcript_13167/g.28805 Transcript_13167/m.28805 type:complete len:413 (+) Transcript_13167:109-1347(+)